jgi:hypothetical protein
MAAIQWPTARDFVEANQNPSTSFADPEMKAATPARDRLGMPLVTAGQFAYVFKLNAANGSKAQAVRCFRGFLGDREQRYQVIDDCLERVSIPSLASFEYDADGITVAGRKYPMLVMEWIDGLPLDVYLAEVFQRSDVVKFLAGLWLKTIRSLKDAGIAHGDLQHGNIVIQKERIRLVDLDGMFVPAMARSKAAELGHQHYQHPGRTSQHFSSELDNFSALVIYLSLLAIAEHPELWVEFHDENLIFKKQDFLVPGASPLFARLQKVASVKLLVDTLVTACNQGPLKCPYLLDLVTPPSRLPDWMDKAPNVRIKTPTREAKGAPTVPPLTGTPLRQGAAQRSTSTPAPAPPVIAAPGEAFQKTLRYALDYAFINIFWAWLWFPLLCRVFLAGQVPSDVARVLSIGIFLSACLWLGHRRAVAVSPPQPVRPSPPIVTVSSSAPPNTIRPSPAFGTAAPLAPPTTLKPPYFAQGSQPARFVGNRIRMVFHRPDCEWARKISRRNRTSFVSSSEARKNGYRSCRVCNP